jgi:hypothetical protein
MITLHNSESAVSDKPAKLGLFENSRHVQEMHDQIQIHEHLFHLFQPRARAHHNKDFNQFFMLHTGHGCLTIEFVMVIQITTRDCCKEICRYYFGWERAFCKSKQFSCWTTLMLQLFRPEEKPSS